MQWSKLSPSLYHFLISQGSVSFSFVKHPLLLGRSQLLRRHSAACPLLRVDQTNAAHDRRRLATARGHHCGVAVFRAGTGEGGCGDGANERRVFFCALRDGEKGWESPYYSNCTSLSVSIHLKASLGVYAHEITALSSVLVFRLLPRFPAFFYNQLFFSISWPLIYSSLSPSLFGVSLQGNRMLTVKGTGGDSSKASASSFATSAAAFGAVPEVTMLRGVEDDGTCEWDQRISFAWRGLLLKWWKYYSHRPRRLVLKSSPVSPIC